MRKRTTISELNDALLQLARAVENYTARNDAYWAENDRRWAQNDRRWEQNDRRWEQNDRRWEQNERRLTNLADGLAAMEARMNLRFDRLEERLKIVERRPP